MIDILLCVNKIILPVGLYFDRLKVYFKHAHGYSMIHSARYYGFRWLMLCFAWIFVAMGVLSIEIFPSAISFFIIGSGVGVISLYHGYCLHQYTGVPFRERPVWGLGFHDKRSVIALYAIGAICIFLSCIDLF